MALSGAPNREEKGELDVDGKVKVSYWAKVSTFGREFGVAVAVDAPGVDLDDEALMRKINDVTVRKHRELELAWLDAKE